MIPLIRPAFLRPYLGGGFKYCLFIPLLGEMIQLDEHIFQMGRFSHQLEEIFKTKKVGFRKVGVITHFLTLDPNFPGHPSKAGYFPGRNLWHLYWWAHSIFPRESDEDPFIPRCVEGFESFRCAIGSINSLYFHIIGDGHQPNSRGLYTHYKDSY